MDLFTTIENTNTTVPDIITQLTEGNKFYAGYRKLTNYLHVQGWFLHALEQRDKDALEFLMAKEQDCPHWKTKQEFIDKFIGTCSKLEVKQPIFLEVLRGISFEKENFHAGKPGISIEVKSVAKNTRLWKFNVTYHLDKEKKIHLYKINYFWPDIHLWPHIKQRL